LVGFAPFVIAVDDHEAAPAGLPGDAEGQARIDAFGAGVEGRGADPDGLFPGLNHDGISPRRIAVSVRSPLFETTTGVSTLARRSSAAGGRRSRPSRFSDRA
jgi:hypothetical protein